MGSISKLLRLGGLVTSVLILAVPARASNAALGTISVVLAVPNGVVMFNQSGSRTAIPACAASNPTRWVIDATQPGGAAMVALLLSAYATNKQVVVIGTGACSAMQTDTEQVSFFGTQN